MIGLRSPTIYHGPNPLAADPVLVVDVVPEEAGMDRLLQAVAAMRERTADWYRHAPADESLPPQQRIGAFLAAWSLQALTFVRGHLAAHGCAPDPATGRLRAWVGFHDAQLSFAALSLGARWLGALARGPAAPDSFAVELERIWQACRQRHPDYQASIVMQAARRSGIPYAPAWGLARHWRFGQGARSRVFFESASCADGHLGTRAAGSKALTKAALQSLGLPTPEFRIVAREAELEAAVAVVGYPCVTKPLDRGGGKGVSAGLRDLNAVRQGFAAARAASRGPVMVEAHVEGEDHRLMVVRGRLVAAIRREPPSVTGDGQRTIRELVAAQNAGRDARSLARSGFKRPIELDAGAQLHLAGLGLSADAVIEAGRTVRVRSNANLSTGGDCIDVTRQLHPEVRALAEMLARTLGLPMMGADYLATHIDRSPMECGGRFIEINTTPGLDALVTAGWPVEDAGDLALAASGEAPGRIPIDLLIVPRTALPEACAALQACAWPPGSGWAGTDRASLAGTALATGAAAPWAGVQCLLGHRGTTRAVVVACGEDIARHGLPLDACRTAHLLDELPPAWLQVLRGASEAVHLHDGARGGRAALDEAVARLLAPSGDAHPPSPRADTPHMRLAHHDRG